MDKYNYKLADNLPYFARESEAWIPRYIILNGAGLSSWIRRWLLLYRDQGAENVYQRSLINPVKYKKDASLRRLSQMMSPSALFSKYGITQNSFFGVLAAPFPAYLSYKVISLDLFPWGFVSWPALLALGGTASVYALTKYLVKNRNSWEGYVEKDFEEFSKGDQQAALREYLISLHLSAQEMKKMALQGSNRFLSPFQRMRPFSIFGSFYTKLDTKNPKRPFTVEMSKFYGVDEQSLSQKIKETSEFFKTVNEKAGEFTLEKINEYFNSSPEEKVKIFQSLLGKDSHNFAADWQEIEASIKAQEKSGIAIMQRIKEILFTQQSVGENKQASLIQIFGYADSITEDDFDFIAGKYKLLGLISDEVPANAAKIDHQQEVLKKIFNKEITASARRAAFLINKEDALREVNLKLIKEAGDRALAKEDSNDHAEKIAIIKGLTLDNILENLSWEKKKEYQEWLKKLVPIMDKDSKELVNSYLWNPPESYPFSSLPTTFQEGMEEGKILLYGSLSEALKFYQTQLKFVIEDAEKKVAD